MEAADPFVSRLEGWRRDVMVVGRFVAGILLALSLLGVVAVPVLARGDSDAAHLGAVAFVLLMLLGPMVLPPVAYWCDWTVSSVGDWLYVETFLGGRRTVQLSKLCRISTRLVVGRGGSAYCAALWEDGQRLPRVILTWDASGEAHTKTLLRRLASSPSVKVSRRARVALQLPDPPGLPERLIMASRTLGIVIVYIALVYAVSWGYLTLVR